MTSKSKHGKLLPSMLSHLLLEVFAVKHIPVPTARWYLAGERHNFLTHHVIDMIFALKEFLQHLLRVGKRAAFVKETREAFLPEPIQNEMGQVRDPILGQTTHRMKPLLVASFCFAKRNIL